MLCSLKRLQTTSSPAITIIVHQLVLALLHTHFKCIFTYHRASLSEGINFTMHNMIFIKTRLHCYENLMAFKGKFEKDLKYGLWATIWDAWLLFHAGRGKGSHQCH